MQMGRSLKDIDDYLANVGNFVGVTNRHDASRWLQLVVSRVSDATDLPIV